MNVRGVRTRMSALTIGARKSATSSEYSRAIILGDISPSTRISTVTITVAIVGPILEPHVMMP